MPMEIASCSEGYRVGKGGQQVHVETCSVEGSLAVLIFKDGVLRGVTGNPDKKTASALAKVIGKAKTEVLKITL